MKKQLTLSQAIEGYFLYVDARRLSKRTTKTYRTIFNKFQHFLDNDPSINSVTVHQVEKFLASVPHLTKKTLLNYHIGLSALWTWALGEELVEKHIVRKVARPRPEKRAIQPLSKEDVRAMLEACGQTNPYTRPGKRACQNSRPTETRDRAIVLLLLDTGIRASELSGLTITNTDLKNRKILVFGKGSKERVIPFSASTGKAIWRYRTTRPNIQPKDALFLTSQENPLDSDALRLLVKRLGHRAGVANAHPHRFRHTFAINFLRNGGNAYVLQMLLGHSTLDMVKRYLLLAGNDAEAAHQLASPVANWRL